MKLLYSTPNMLLVNHVRNLLQASGIDSLLKNEFLGGGAGELPPTEAWPELWVADEDYAEALRLIDELQQGSSHPSWRCPRCGEMVEGQFNVCWKCGTPRQVDAN